MSLDLSVNYVAVVAATIAVMVFGFVFFLPQVFGARWMALIGRPNEPMRPGPEFVVSILAAFAHGLIGQMITSPSVSVDAPSDRAIVAAWR